MTERLNNFEASFGGVPMAQYFVDLYLWEVVLNENRHLKGIIEIGTWQGGLSWYLWAQAQAREMGFITFDAITPGKEPPRFSRVDVFRDPQIVKNHAHRFGPIALFCDGGNKPRELETFPPLVHPDSVVLVHDWGTETLPEDVPDFLEETMGDLCDELGSITRVFTIRKEAA